MCEQHTFVRMESLSYLNSWSTTLLVVLQMHFTLPELKPSHPTHMLKTRTYNQYKYILSIGCICDFCHAKKWWSHYDVEPWTTCNKSLGRARPCHVIHKCVRCPGEQERMFSLLSVSFHTVTCVQLACLPDHFVPSVSLTSPKQEHTQHKCIKQFINVNSLVQMNFSHAGDWSPSVAWYTE